MVGTVIWVATCGRLQGTHPDDCQVLRVMWDAGNSQTFHSNSDKIALKHRKQVENTTGPQESDMPAEAYYDPETDYAAKVEELGIGVTRTPNGGIRLTGGEAPTPDKKVRILEQYKEGKMTTDEALDAISDILAEEEMPPVTDEKDFAHKVYMEALSRPRRAWWKIQDILGGQPYLVIGDFAYLLGYDGDYYQVPVKYVKADRYPDNTDTHVFTVMWREAVEVHGSMAEYIERLGNVISDMGNIADIMHQSGVVTDTPKLHKSDDE